MNKSTGKRKKHFKATPNFTERLTFSIALKERKDIQRVAKARQISVSEVVRGFIKDGIKGADE